MKDDLLVGGVPTPLKNMFSSVGMIVPNIWKSKKCSKPPTSQLDGYNGLYIFVCHGRAPNVRLIICCS
jgi:hypothetical protein